MTSLRTALFETTHDEKRTDDYYSPVAGWVLGLLEKFRSSTKRPYFLGISGPQGSGKSTLAESLAKAFPQTGIKTVTFSTDDLYRTHDELTALAKAHPGDPLFQVRGFAGTHDVDLGARVLASLAAGRPTKIPKYDKAAHDGKGDRAPESAWAEVNEPMDLVIFEGWSLGFRARPDDSVEPALRTANSLLGAYAAWTKPFDAFVLLEAGELDFIVDWRVGSERQRREKGEKTMSDSDARAYIERFIPVYRDYVPELVQRPPTDAFMKIVLGKNRQPVTMFGTVAE
ncbi:MAG: zeta toxin family protein [Polyangiaceae bacterium]